MNPQIVYGLAFACMELGDNRAGEGAFYTGAGDRGNGGLARPGEPRSVGAAGESYFSVLEPPGPPREYASRVLRAPAPGIFASAFLPLGPEPARCRCSTNHLSPYRQARSSSKGEGPAPVRMAGCSPP